ncbi:scar-like domain-containing protein WAVE 5 [Lotus japonicus]|uniref:scar-like domain-containing protein WAVE 5 n=1 Tax=Lotus japonicus TaxID=34305 RepID=UPI00258B425D|nr:scar-like domain-containing protein WAVE 5 [Lotus japonicus]
MSFFSLIHSPSSIRTLLNLLPPSLFFVSSLWQLRCFNLHTHPLSLSSPLKISFFSLFIPFIYCFQSHLHIHSFISEQPFTYKGQKKIIFFCWVFTLSVKGRSEMPLVRLQVRNEFNLGQPELYREANREDPKAVLDGVAVAGLVGILRQLGDLADFAAEVFHGLQEQVMTTASRSHRLNVRVRNIEASLPSLERAVLAQTSHIHFAYTAGCEWHPRIKTARNHFIYNDLPHFIMDSYEECREPPRVHLLDKFDTSGPGSCFRRYSDPTFFRRVSTDLDEPYSEKTEKARKSRKSKKRRSSRRTRELLRGEQMHSSSGRMQFSSSTINGRTSSSQAASTIDMAMKSDMEDYSNSFDSKSGAGYIECVFHPSNYLQPDEQDCKEPSSSRSTQKINNRQSVSPAIDDSISHDSLEKKIASSSSGVTWDEKEEIVESNSQACDTDKITERLVEKHDSDMRVEEAVATTNIDYNDILYNEERNLKQVSSRVQIDDIDSEPDDYMDALNTIESESEIDLDYETKRELQRFTSLVTDGMVENEVTRSPSKLLDNNVSDVLQTVPLNKDTGEEESDPISEPHASNLGLVSPSNVLDSMRITGDTFSVRKEAFREPDFLQEIPSLPSEPHASNLGSVSPSDVLDSEKITRDPDSLNKEAFRELDLPQEIPPVPSEPHVSNSEPVNPSDVAYSEEITRETVSVNKEMLGNSPDSLQEIPPLIPEPHAEPENLSDILHSQEITREAVSLNKEMFGNLPDSQQGIPPLTPEPHASNLGYVSSSDVSSTKNVADSHSSESPNSEQDRHTHKNDVLDHSVYTHTFSGSHTANDTVSAPIKTDISFSDSRSSNSPDEEAGKINNSICKYEETRRDSLGDHPVSFWTNGGLLGLEPSKPPDFDKSSSLSQGPLSSKSEMDGVSRHDSMQKSNGHKEQQELSHEVTEQNRKGSSFGFSTARHNDGRSCISEKTSGSSQLSNGFCQTERNSLAEAGVMAPGSVLPAGPATRDCTEHSQGNGENSSRMFGLGPRLLLKSFNRKVSFDEKSGPYNSLRSVILEQSGQNDTADQPLPETTFKEKAGSGYPIDSLPPSPPLENMKISFRPVSGLEISKLKLKFPDGSNHHESIREMFPSFQLVPESSSIPLDDSVSHSDDDDTFCRSSPYVSDGCHTPCSDYDSDQWESDETPESSDHGVLDSPHSEPMLSSKVHGGVSNDDTNIKSGHGTYNTNGVEPSLSGSSLDFPSYDTVNPFFEKESNEHSKCNNVVMLHSQAEPTPPPPPRPPPLPPTQCRVSKPQLDVTNETQNNMSEDAEHIYNRSLSESTIFQQRRIAKVEQIQSNHDGHESYENMIHQLKEKLDQPKLNGWKEANQLRMGKETDEREDFLHQIRAKSFNLRPTVTGKPNATTVPTASVKVTAILEKANAIRQVVGSDDGEEDDDTWSDT